MVAVVVDYGHAAHFAAHLKAAIDTAEGGKAGGDRVRRDPKLHADGDRGRGVQYVVASRHVQFERPQRP